MEFSETGIRNILNHILLYFRQNKNSTPGVRNQIYNLKEKITLRCTRPLNYTARVISDVKHVVYSEPKTSVYYLPGSKHHCQINL